MKPIPENDKFICDTVIVGAGAAGLFCAWELARANKPFLMLEGGEKAGRKLAACGGGHANFSNSVITSECYAGLEAQVFCKYALRKITLNEISSFISCLGFNFHQKENGKYFIRESASALVAKLLKTIGDRLILNARVSQIESRPREFTVHFKNKFIKCKNLILAPGSPANPKLAQCPDCWAILKAMGLPITPARPALAPLIYPDNHYGEFVELSGLSLPVKANINPIREDYNYIVDSLLFTHFGLSGPVILNLSLYFNKGDTLHVDFLPHFNFEKLCDERGRQTPQQILNKLLPRKLSLTLLPKTLSNRKCATLSRKERQELGIAVNAREFANLRLGGLARAEICAGGVELGSLNPYTMQTRDFPGLYVIGEAQNVAGRLGGYNIHWAFASAMLAAKNIIAGKID